MNMFVDEVPCWIIYDYICWWIWWIWWCLCC